MKKNRIHSISVFILILTMAACSGQPAGTPGSNADAASTVVAQTVAALVASPTAGSPATETPIPATDTPTTASASATLASATATPGLSSTQVCDMAQFVTETIPDDSIVLPGAAFTKSWRLKNSGSCTWTSAYAVVFLNGDALNAPNVVPLTGNVAPGQEVDVSVEMQAPAAPGNYTGNWNLRNASGVLFGVGSSNGPFWIKISVVAATATATKSGLVAHLPVIPISLLPTSKQVFAQISVPASGNGNVEVTCPSGSIVTGGGFAGSSNLQVYTSSSKSNGWLAAAQNLSASAQGLNAYAECLSNTSGTTQQVFAQVTAAAGGVGHAVVSCPSGSVVTGGGFASNSNLLIYNNSASGNGWEVYAKNKSSNSQLLNAYAICLSGTSGTTQQLVNQVSVAGNANGNAVKACPSGSYLTGGGYAGNQDLFVYTESATGSSWQVYAHNTSGTSQLLNSYAMCLTMH